MSNIRSALAGFIAVILLPTPFSGCRQENERSIGEDKNHKFIGASRRDNAASKSPPRSTDSTPEFLTRFKAAIESNTSSTFDSIMDPAGIAVIRNFSSGSFGGRGQNIRNFYAFPLSSNFEQPVFPVPEETPIELGSMFPDFLKSDIRTLPHFEDTIPEFGIRDSKDVTDPATSKLLEWITLISAKHNDVPTAFVSRVNDRYLILAEGQVIDNMCSGYYSVFTKTGQDYRLRAILDLR